MRERCNLITCSLQIARISDTLQVRANLTISYDAMRRYQRKRAATESNTSEVDRSRYEWGPSLRRVVWRKLVKQKSNEG